MRKLIFILIALISFSQAQTIQYIGAPTTTVISRGNFRTDSIFYLPKRTKLPTDTAAFRYQISDSSLYYWTGYQWTKVQSASSFASVDTTVISTRAYRQKGIDSVQYNVGLKVNISDTSTMLSPYIRHAGYGLTKSSQALSVDTALIATRLRVGKVVDSLSLVKQNVLTNPVTGTGTTNYVPKFTGTSTIGNSIAYDNSGEFLINTTSDAGAYTLQNNGALYNTGSAILAATSGNIGIGGIATYGKFQIYSGTATQVGLSLFTGLESSERTTYVANEGLQLSSYQSVSGSPFTKVSDIVANGDGTAPSVMRFWTKVSGSSSPVEAMRINSAQETLFGTTTDAGNYRVQVSGNAYVSGSLGVGTTSQQQTVHINSTTGGYIQLSRTAQGGTTSPLGGIYFGDGTTFQEAAILSYADGSVTSGDLQFFTKESSSSLSEAMRITSTKQVAIGLASPDASAKVHIFSTTQGFLPPRMTTAQRDAISSPAAGLVIYNTTTSKLQVYTTSWTDLH